MSSCIHIGKVDNICCQCVVKLYPFEYNKKLKLGEICCNHGIVKLPWIEQLPSFWNIVYFHGEIAKRKSFDRTFVLKTVHYKLPL